MLFKEVVNSDAQVILGFKPICIIDNTINIVKPGIIWGNTYEYEY